MVIYALRLFCFIFVFGIRYDMKKLLLLFILSPFLIHSTRAQNPQVLVYGSDAIAFSAAVQAASSGVSTLWITDGEINIGDLTTSGVHKVTANDRLDAGLWATFLRQIANDPNLTDSALRRIKGRINGQLARNAMHRMVDSLSNLTLSTDIAISDIQRKGKKWRVQLNNHKKLKVYAIIDGSKTGILSSFLQEPKRLDPIDPISVSDLYANSSYRSNLVSFDLDQRIYTVPFVSMIQPLADNFYGIHALAWNALGKESVPLQMLTGQAIGAAAAYGAFFKTSSENINIRRLQGELLAFGGTLLPYQDIPHEAPHYIALQRIGATGLFKGNIHNKNGETRFYFDPDKTVSSEEIKPVMLELFTRSQIWFQDKKIEQLTLKDLLDLVKFTALKGDEVNKETERIWSSRFEFKEQYDPDLILNRRQTAVILDHFLHPFKVNIDRNGRFVY